MMHKEYYLRWWNCERWIFLYDTVPSLSDRASEICLESAGNQQSCYLSCAGMTEGKSKNSFHSMTTQPDIYIT